MAARLEGAMHIFEQASPLFRRKRAMTISKAVPVRTSSLASLGQIGCLGGQAMTFFRAGLVLIR